MQISRIATLNSENRCSIYYVKQRLGQDYGDKRLVTYISLLVKERGFPPPLPCLVANRLHDGVHVTSQWIREAVDAWLEDFLPPDNSMAVDRERAQAAADDMDAAACNLRLIAGGRA